jgi:hypothetical protein
MLVIDFSSGSSQFVNSFAVKMSSLRTRTLWKVNKKKVVVPEEGIEPSRGVNPTGF